MEDICDTWICYAASTRTLKFVKGRSDEQFVCVFPWSSEWCLDVFGDMSSKSWEPLNAQISVSSCTSPARRMIKPWVNQFGPPKRQQILRRSRASPVAPSERSGRLLAIRRQRERRVFGHPTSSAKKCGTLRVQ